MRLRLVKYADQLVFRHLLGIKLVFFSFRAVLFWHFRSARMFRFMHRRQKLKGFFFGISFDQKLVAERGSRVVWVGVFVRFNVVKVHPKI